MRSLNSLNITFTMTLLLLAGFLGYARDEVQLVIENVTVIDGRGNAPLEHVNVVVAAGRIAAISAAETTAPAAERIDGSGKFLIPGLIDAHTHPFPYEQNFPIFIHYGVTTVFVPGCGACSNENYAAMRTFSATESVIAPRVYHTSQHFTMEGRHPVKTYPSSKWVEGKTVYYVRDTLQIAAMVAEVAREPIVGIKVTIENGPEPPFVERIPVEFVAKITREAHAHGLKVFAHVDDIEEVRIAQAAGVDHIIHFVGVDIDWEWDAAVIDDLLARDVSWVTTLMIDKSFFYPSYPKWLSAVEAESVFDPKEIKRLRARANARESLDILREIYGMENPTLEKVLQPQLADLRVLHEKGCNLVIGTDTGNDFIFPGLSMHEEMAIMAGGDFKPGEIIRMATHNAARMLGVADELGAIEVGKLADMVLLDKNPLVDIRNTTAIHSVYRGGRRMNRIAAASR